mmetsp:Transcript_5269/g.4464  ORF Transcript_5269/g.4464 Transcript_5269/m.4464 type:complete len:107 (+) Transcript_5269:1858-2178(+)
MRIDPNFTISSQKMSDIALDSLVEFNAVDEELNEFFLYIINQNDNFETNSVQLYFGEACDFLTSKVSICKDIMNNALNMGIVNGKEEVFKNLRRQYTDFMLTNTTT